MNPYLAFMVGLPIGVMIGAAIMALVAAGQFAEIRRELKDARYYRDVVAKKFSPPRSKINGATDD